MVLLQDFLNHGAFRGFGLHNYRYLLKKKKKKGLIAIEQVLYCDAWDVSSIPVS